MLSSGILDYMSLNADDPSQNEALLQTAGRALRLVELLLTRPEGWTPQELVIELDLSRSSLFVLLRTLKALGYVDQAGRRGRYISGPRLQAWRGPLSPSAQDLLTAFYQETDARPMDETLALVIKTGETNSRGDTPGYMIVAQAESTAQVRSSFINGQIYNDLPAAAAVLTPTPAPEVMQSGYALASTSETLDIALPVCRDGHIPNAALLLSAPAFRWKQDELLTAFVDELRGAAAHLSYRLGAPIYAPYQAETRSDLPVTSQLSAAEISSFLQGPWAASLACVRPDGRPHVIPVWQEWDGQSFYVVAWRGSQWADYLTSNPNVSLTIDEPWSPLRRVVVQGSAYPLESGSAEIGRLLRRLTRRYLGSAAPVSIAEQVQRAFRIQPDSVRGWRGLPVSQPARLEKP